MMLMLHRPRQHKPRAHRHKVCSPRNHACIVCHALQDCHGMQRHAPGWQAQFAVESESLRVSLSTQPAHLDTCCSIRPARHTRTRVLVATSRQPLELQIGLSLNIRKKERGAAR
jgi:hypothetical protein